MTQAAREQSLEDRTELPPARDFASAKLVENGVLRAEENDAGVYYGV